MHYHILSNIKAKSEVYILLDESSNVCFKVIEPKINSSNYPYISYDVISKDENKIAIIKRKKFSIMPTYVAVFNDKRKLFIKRKWGLFPKYFVKKLGWQVNAKLIGNYLKRLPTSHLSEGVPDGFEFTLTDEHYEVIAKFGLDTEKEYYQFNVDLINTEKYDNIIVFIIIFSIYLEIQEVTVVGYERTMVLKNIDRK